MFVISLAILCLLGVVAGVAAMLAIGLIAYLIAFVIRLIARAVRTYRPFWSWPVTFAYLFLLWSADTLLARFGMNCRAYPLPFVGLGLGLGLGLTLWEQRRARVHGPAGRK
jgi:hypothetical protein